MKKQIPFLTSLLITVCFILCTNGTMYAQKYTYKPLALEGAHWWVGHTDDNMPPWAPWDHYQYVIRGDSVLNNVIYKKVFYRDLMDQNPHLIEYEVFAGIVVRDDTLNKKVYAIDFAFPPIGNCPLNEEFLLYEFDVNVGDTINACLMNWTAHPIIQSIYYEFIYGQERKVINTEMWGQLFEGIGSQYGVFEWGFGSKDTMIQDRGWASMLFDYCLGTDEECGCQWVNIEETDEIPPLIVYPNPFMGNTFTLIPQIPITQPLDIKLYDIAGREVYQRHFENITQEVNIQIPASLSSGTSPIILWAGNNKQLIFKQIIIKQKIN